MSITKISPSVVDFDDGITITVDDNSAALTIKSTDADSANGPIIDLVRDSASPADSDSLGMLRFKADNDAGEETIVANIKATVVDVSDGSEDGRLLLQTMIDGTSRNRIEITNTEVVVNQSGVDSNFRVESDSDANILFVDGGNNVVGLGTGSPTSPNSVNRFLHIHNADHSSIVLSDDQNTWEIVSNNNLTIRDGTDTRLTVDTSGKVGIGTTPDYKMHIFTADSSASAHANADDLFIENSGNAGMTIGSGTTSNGSIFFSDSDSSLSGQIEYRHNDDSLMIITGGSNRLHIQADGDLDITDGNLVVASGHGIDFSATANATGSSSELLDDYEEGSWSPSMSSGSVSGNQCQYTKVGNLVTLRGNLADITDNSTNSDMTLTGLPFTAGSNNRAVGATMFRYFSKTNAIHMNAYLGQNDTNLSFYWSFNAASSPWEVVEYDDGTQANMDIIFTIAYITT